MLLKKLRTKRPPLLKIILSVVVLTVFWYGGTARNVSAGNIPLEELRLFSDVFVRVKSDYVEEVSDVDLIENAIDGMMRGLDPHSRYMRKKEYQDLKVGTTGKFGGLGIQFLMDENRVRVISIIEGGPSEKAGLLPGDLIVTLDGEDVTQMDMDTAVDTMRGEVGTKIKIGVIREGVTPFEVEIVRAIIKVESIKHAMLAPDIAYMRISNFQNNTGESLLNKIREAKRENKNIGGIILDLRGNPGGVLESAIRVTDVFLDANKLVVYTKGRIEGSTVQFKTVSSDSTNKIPIIVLINGGSASASEIVAGALQDHKRAVLMGSKSFGKGSVQTVHQLRKDRAIRLTTAKYYTPSGRSIHDIGIEPDIKIPPLTVEELEALKKQQELEPEIEPWKIDLSMRLKKDTQVQQAITHLRTMIAKVAAKRI